MDTATLSFLFTKLIGFLLSPWSVMVAGLFAAYLLIITTRGLRFGRWLLTIILVCYVIFGMFPVGTWALATLEERFPPVRQHETPVVGIMVLAGSFNTRQTRLRDQVAIGGSVERVTEFMRLARQYPEAKLAFIGGQGRVYDLKPSESDVAKRHFAEMGMDTTRIHFEDRSRNTEEGARFAYEELTPGDEPWILITSASHMPRAVGLFRKAGWTIIAHPADYKTAPRATISWLPSWPGSLGRTGGALYEWVALVYAWARGRIDEPFPAPAPKPNARPG